MRLAYFLLTYLLFLHMQDSVDAQMAGTTMQFASLETTSGDDGKDHDTCLDVVVTAADGTRVAHADKAACGKSDSNEYKENSRHTLHLQVDTAIKWEQAVGFTAMVTQHTNGNDTWKWCGGVNLFFPIPGRGGSALIRQALPEGSNCTTLKNDGASAQLKYRE